MKGEGRPSAGDRSEEERRAFRAGFLGRLRAECIDEEQWLQEYCCVAADESTAFITYEMLTACTEAELRLVGFEEPGPIGRIGRMEERTFYLGVDVARKKDLCVLDLGEKIGDVVWDRMRIELSNKTFAEIRFELYRLLRLPQVKRCCIDASGLGMQLSEEAKREFGWKVEPITFTAAIKEELAFGLRRDFEERRVRIPADERLRSDLRGIKKEVTLSGNIRFAGESADSHCDRFWAKALRQHGARMRKEVGAIVG